MNDRFLTILNVALLGVCGFCLWFLITVDYERPPEIVTALRTLENTRSPQVKVETFINQASGLTETRTVAIAMVTSSPTPLPTPKDYPNLNKNFMQPLYTPTPTPTPTPAPTPAPPSLFNAVASWILIGITDEKTVEIKETREKEERTFTMTVGGPPEIAKDTDGREVQVRLISVDLDNYKIKLGFMDQTEEKAM